MKEQHKRTAERNRLGQARFSWRWSLGSRQANDEVVQRTQSSLCRAAFLPVLFMLFTLACGREPGIIVNIAEWPDGVERIRVRTTIDGSVGTDIYVNKDQTRFVVRVPASSQGTVDLDVIALDLMGCKRATGSLTEPVPGNLSRFVERTLELAPVSLRGCVFTDALPNSNIAIGGSQPYSVAVGDFNGDTKLDLAIANASSGTVIVWLGNGQGGFGVGPTLTGFINPRSVAVGDFNGDTKLDLAVANYDSTFHNVSLLRGNGSGGFIPVANIPVGPYPLTVAFCDFNGDMKQDLVSSNTGDGTVSVILGDGLGGYISVKSFAINSFGASFVLEGDFNGDMKKDLAVANAQSNNVSVLLGDGKGAFGAATLFSVGTAPYSVAVGDFNGDMKQDLAVANSASNSVSVLLGNGLGSFSQPPLTLAVGKMPYSVAVGDFNGDLKPDLAVANSGEFGNPDVDSVSVLLGDGLGAFGSANSFKTDRTSRAVVVGDFNSDRKPDLAVANVDGNTVSILLNQF